MRTISDTILDQLGGSKFLVMTGARHLVTSGNDLSMRLPRSALNRINHVRIVLEANDTYTVVFSQIRGITVHVVHTSDMVHADQLRAIFERHTGLRVSL